MKRYKALNFEYDDAFGTGTALDIVEDEKGEFVKYDDIKHLLERSDNKDYAVTPKEYHCEKSDTKMCKYGGNKRFNYGFMSGTSGYCRFFNEWLHEIEVCSQPQKNKESQKKSYRTVRAKPSKSKVTRSAAKKAAKKTRKM